MWVKHFKGVEAFQLINFDRINFIDIRSNDSETYYYVWAEFSGYSKPLYQGTLEKCRIYIEDVLECIQDSKPVSVLGRTKGD